MRESDRTEELGTPLLRMAEDPGSTTLSRLWTALDVADRRQVIRAALASDEEDDVRPWAVDAVAKHRSFRRETVRAWDDEKLARMAALPRVTDLSVLQTLLRVHHLNNRRALLSDYLDELGLAHAGGVLDPDEIPDLGAEQVAAVSAELQTRFPAADVVFYLLTLRLLTPALVPGLDDWLPGLVETPDELHAEEPDESIEGSVASGAPERTDQFSTLDVQMVRTIVDVAQGVRGALDADALEDLVNELITLNSDRHHSYFHLGFSDAVLARAARSVLPAQNESRLLWYWSGYVSGLARMNRWHDIVEAFDGTPAIRKLGASGAGPCSTAAPLIFESLSRADRSAEAAAFLSVEALIDKPELARQVHERGRALLREDRAEEARAPMDLLGQLVRRLESAGVPSTHRLLLEIRRRRAHCFRQLGEYTKAREILERLLDEEPKDDVRSMVLTDLGLIEGGFRSLAHVAIPAREDRRSRVLEALQEGEERFRAGAEIDARHAVHGRYCLGVLALLRSEWGKAARELEPSLSVFASEAERYRSGGLLDRTRLYLGIALALSLDVIRTEKAAELIEQALNAGAVVPPYLLPDLLEAIHMGSEESARELGEILLDCMPDQLDGLAGSAVARKTPSIACALIDRADPETRTRAERSQDLRRALPLLLNQGLIEEAGGVLDRLEEMARGGAGTSEFLKILADPGAHEPAWEGEEVLWARIHLLGSAGRREEAIPLLEEEFWRALHADSFGSIERAEGILDTLGDFGASDEDLARLGSAMETRRPDDEDEPDETLDRRVKVLFVGGDEREASHVEAVQAALAESHPRISVDFEHPGWSGNWGPALDDLKARLPRYDALVIMRFIRTEFGKQLRKAVEVPWAGCNGPGRRRMISSIVMAARMARKHRHPGNA